MQIDIYIYIYKDWQSRMKGLLRTRNYTNVFANVPQVSLGFDFGLRLVHSPILRELHLVSFPQLNDIHKFKDTSRPTQSWIIE